MKYLLSVVVVCILLSACKKDDSLEDHYFGSSSAKLNNFNVFFNKCRAHKKNDTLYFNFERWNVDVKKEEIGFMNVLNNKTKQRLNKNDYTITQQVKLSSIYGTSQDDGDVGCDYYEVYEADSIINHITISYYNQNTEEISGTFNGTYLVTKPKCKQTAPDTLRITNGVFNTKIF